MVLIDLSTGAVEYADYIPAERYKPPQECPGYETKQHLSMKLSPRTLGNVEYIFITFTPRSTLTRISSTGLGPVYGGSRTVQSFTGDYNKY